MAYNIETTLRLNGNQVTYSEVAGTQRSYNSSGDLIFDADGKSIKLESNEGSGLSAVFIGPTEFAIGSNYTGSSLNTGLISIAAGTDGTNWISLNVSGESVIWSFDNSASTSTYSSVNNKSPLFLSTKVADLTSIGTISNAVIAGLELGQPDQSNTLFLQEGRFRSELNYGTGTGDYKIISDQSSSVTGHIGYLKGEDTASTTITASQVAGNWIELENLYNEYLSVGLTFTIVGGPLAGTWTVVSSSIVGPNTRVVVSETVPSDETTPAGAVTVTKYQNDLVFATNLSGGLGSKIQISDWSSYIGYNNLTNSAVGYFIQDYDPNLDTSSNQIYAKSGNTAIINLTAQDSNGKVIINLKADGASGVEITDESSRTGLYYNGDYSINGIANRSDRWIPDVGWVNTQIGSSGSSYGTTYFVAPQGDDTTGAVGNINKPWQTIKAAVTQAVTDGLTNPLIYVFPGTYTDRSIQFEGGTFFFTPGALITGGDQYHGTTGIVAVNQGTQTFTTPGNFETHFNVPGKKFKILGSSGNDGIYTVSSAVNNATNTDIVVVEVIPSATANGRLTDQESIFAVGSGHAGVLISGTVANVVKVYGEVSFDIPATIDNDWPGSPFSCNTDADLYVEMHSIKVEQGTGLFTVDNAKVTLNGEFFELTTSGYATSLRDASDVVLNFQRITCGGNYGIFLRNGNTAGFSGTCRIEAEEIICSGTANNIVFSNVLPGAKVFIECPDINQTGTGKAIFNLNQTGGEIYITGNTRAADHLYAAGSGGYMKIEGDFIATANGASTMVIVGGNTYINGDLYCESGVTALVTYIAHSLGTLRLNGRIQNPSVGGFGISKTGGTLILDTAKIITDGDSINATTAQDIKVIHSLAVKTAVNANITNAIIGSSIITDAGIE